MAEMLEYLMQNSDEQFQRQIQYILTQLSSESPQSDQEEEEEEGQGDDEEEEDEEYGDEEGDGEAEGEEDAEYNDTIKIEGVLVGEDLLTSQFVLPGEAAMTQTMTISKKIEMARD